MGLLWEPFGPQDASKTGSRAPKTRPRALQEASKTGPRAPKRPPRPPQEASKTAPGGLEVAKRLQEASGELFGIHFTCILGPILMPKQSPHKPADNCSCGSYKTPSNTRTLPRTGQKQSPTPLNDDSSCRQNRRAKPQNEGAAVDRRMAS